MNIIQKIKTLFNHFKSFQNNHKTNIPLSYNNVDLAEQLFNSQTLGGYIDDKYSSQVNAILKECTPVDSKYPERQQVLLKIIEMIGEPKTPKERYIIAISYAWSRVEYREKAIYYLNLYLNNELYVNIYAHRKYGLSSNISLKENEKHHLIEMYDYLAKAYIGIYDFNKALAVGEKMININPNDQRGYFVKTEILSKQGKLQECKTWLEQIKTSPYYKIQIYYDVLGRKIEDSYFCKAIDRLLEDTENKIKKNYIYKPKIHSNKKEKGVN